MPFQKVQSEKLASAVVRQIEQLILRGILRPGERLPAERELSERMGVSRPSLREALSELQEAGLLVARAGAGVYVAEVLGSAFSPALVRLFATHDDAVYDALDFRRDVEGLAADRAARHGSETDLAVIDAAMNKLEAAPPAEAVALDAEFHMAIIEASNNVVLLHMMRSMYDLLEGGVFYNRQVVFARCGERDLLLDQHRAINAALQARDGAAARAAIEAHLDYIAAAYRDQKRAEANEEISQRRLRHDIAR
ncbi:FadR/GntR family transcriptional regulator [Sinisalibacter aestuarii]|uniref:Pyruvate dehydrogenase complex repressor n=1 Tax=Sinisalibacter aestuarii TaxID=2949426 RepID=A0ABQ5LTX4_9RHOB|nr:FCD domain-containing protein [Sinisalibacter aestuarii]GKY88228.1 GntR family transcriptional regulator [Sinisalibacter aestuarii]